MSISNISGNNSASSEMAGIEENSSTDDSKTNEDVGIIDDCIKLLLELKGTRGGTQGSTQGSTHRSTHRSTGGATDNEIDSNGHALLADLGLISQEQLNDLETAQASISSGERGAFQRETKAAGQRSLERAVQGKNY